MSKAGELLDSLEKYRVVVMCGLPGSGKSYWAKKIAKRVGAVVLSSDVIREELFGSGRLDLLGDRKIRSLSDKAYDVLYDEAVALVGGGKRVIIDATNLKPRRAGDLVRLKEVSDSVVVLVVKSDRKVIGARMKMVAGRANEEESYYQAWKRVVGYFDRHFERREYTWPSEDLDGVRVVVLEND